MIDYNQITNKETIVTIKEITERLIKHFREHIGLEESTTPRDIFTAVMKINPEDMSIYKREFWWNIIKRITGSLKKEDILFVIHRGQKWFVLLTEDELDYYKKMQDRHIASMEKSKILATEWVRLRKWENI